MSAAQKLLGSPTIVGGRAQAGGGGGGSQIRPHAARNLRKQLKKTAGFTHFLSCKSSKTLFFTQNYLTKYTPGMFFEEYINFKTFCYLRHCGVIPV
jgi:hypothetical protein